MADSASPVVVSSNDSNVEYGKIITGAGTGILLSGNRCHATVGLVVASSAGVELTGQDCSADCGNIISTEYDGILSAGTSTRHSVKAIHVSASSDAITLEGTGSRLTVEALTIFGNDSVINFEGTGTAFVRCQSLTFTEDFVLASAVGVAEIHADYISKTSGTIGLATSSATVRVYGATIANAVSCTAGTLELIDCVCLGLVTQSSAGVVRYNAGTQFRAGTSGTVTVIGLAANTVTASAIASDAVDELAAAAGLGAGATARSIVVTVEDASANKISGARVHVLTSGGAATAQAPTTGVLGTATVVLNDGSYKLRIVPPNGYQTPSDQTLTVTSGSSAVTVVVTAITITAPDDPTLATLVVNCVDQTGAAEAGVTIEAKMITVPSGSTGIAFDSKTQTATSGADGIATLTVVRQATYQVRRGDAKTWSQVVIANAATTTVSSILGQP